MSKKSNNTKKRFSPSFETLERRDAMSVTSVALVGTTLKVSADAGNDNIEIREFNPVLATARVAGTSSSASPAASAASSARLAVNLLRPVGDFGIFGSTIQVIDHTRTTGNVYSFSLKGIKRLEITSGAGNDLIVSKSNLPTGVYGGAGNDHIETGAGADLVYGGSGNDYIATGNGNDTVFGELGNDTILGNAGNDYLDGGLGNDVVLGGAGNDTLYGGDTNSPGNLLYGEAGNDTIYSTNRNDVVDGGTGFDSLNVKAGTWIVRNGEKVMIDVPTDQTQNDGWSCGPNSASRFLRSYGINVSYNTLRSMTQENSLLSRFHLGTLPGTLRDLVKHFKSDTTLEKESNLNRVLELLGQGKPVIALVAAGKVDLSIGGTIGLMHYVVLKGFDEATGKISYVDTNGSVGAWTTAEFDYRWKWFDHFNGILGEAAQAGLEALGMRKRTIIF